MVHYLSILDSIHVCRCKLELCFIFLWNWLKIYLVPDYRRESINQALRTQFKWSTTSLYCTTLLSTSCITFLLTSFSSFENSDLEDKLMVHYLSILYSEHVWHCKSELCIIFLLNWLKIYLVPDYKRDSIILAWRKHF